MLDLKSIAFMAPSLLIDFKVSIEQAIKAIRIDVSLAAYALVNIFLLFFDSIIIQAHGPMSILIFGMRRLAHFIFMQYPPSMLERGVDCVRSKNNSFGLMSSTMWFLRRIYLNGVVEEGRPRFHWTCFRYKTMIGVKLVFFILSFIELFLFFFRLFFLDLFIFLLYLFACLYARLKCEKEHEQSEDGLNYYIWQNRIY